MLSTYLGLATLMCLYFLLLSLKNKETLKSLTYSPEHTQTPSVSVLVPARDEEDNIAACLESLLDQDYPNYEVLALDDNSDDHTWMILSGYAKKSKRLKIYKGKALPREWVGKQYACQQLIEKARGEFIMFTDADTVHSRASISWAVTNMLRHNADFMSAYLHHLIGSLGEALIVPAIYIMTTILMPLWKIPQKNSAFFSFAIGQLMVCRRRAILAIGGYASFKDSVVEDISLARAMKAHGYKTIFLDGKDYINCRMYRSFRGAFNGFVKSMFGALHQSILFLAALFIVVAAVIEIPVLNLIRQFYEKDGNILLSLVPVSMFGGLWFIVLRDRKISPSIALSYPILFLIVMIMAVTSTVKTGFLRGVEWKGRLVRCGLRYITPKTPDRVPPARVGGRYLYPLHGLVALCTYWLTFMLVLLFNTLVFHLRIKGRRYLREARTGCFFISNHSLYLDPAIIAQVVAPRRTFFTAMEQTFDMPFVGYYIRLLGAFPVSERLPFSSLVRVTRDILKNNGCIHFFPEGDLTPRSHSMAPFKAGVFYLAWLHDKPIIPVVINTIPKKFLGITLPPLFIRVEAVVCKPIYPRRFGRAGGGKAEIISRLAGRAREVMSAVLQS